MTPPNIQKFCSTKLGFKIAAKTQEAFSNAKEKQDQHDQEVESTKNALSYSVYNVNVASKKPDPNTSIMAYADSKKTVIPSIWDPANKVE